MGVSRLHCVGYVGTAPLRGLLIKDVIARFEDEGLHSCRTGREFVFLKHP